MHTLFPAPHSDKWTLMGRPHDHQRKTARSTGTGSIWNIMEGVVMCNKHIMLVMKKKKILGLFILTLNYWSCRSPLHSGIQWGRAPSAPNTEMPLVMATGQTWSGRNAICNTQGFHRRSSQYEVSSSQWECWGFALAAIGHCGQTAVLAEGMRQKAFSCTHNTFLSPVFNYVHKDSFVPEVTLCECNI